MASSRRARTWSTPLLEAASSSSTSRKLPFSMPTQEGHWQQGSPSTGCSQLTALAKILAQVVLPVPRVPVKRYAWEVRPSATCLRSVWVMWDWPMTSENILGRHLRYRA